MNPWISGVHVCIARCCIVARVISIFSLRRYLFPLEYDVSVSQWHSQRVTAAATGKKKSSASTVSRASIVERRRFPRLPQCGGSPCPLSIDKSNRGEVSTDRGAPIRISYSNADSIHAGIMAAVERGREHGEGEIEARRARVRRDKRIRMWALISCGTETLCSLQALWERVLWRSSSRARGAGDARRVDA